MIFAALPSSGKAGPLRLMSWPDGSWAMSLSCGPGDVTAQGPGWTRGSGWEGRASAEPGKPRGGFPIRLAYGVPADSLSGLADPPIHS
ncbi:hypothetical protein GCM10011360_05340 [Primorskyibacter flagellatus]|uniref:Uncharacterized protein n=1 Tax=Primorskyibacter flagellatus TaxID=1387277 RepID=A0A917EBU3_9RHOB|nr:hypothetical protein GCM10011360_05340 [Primorskyibacter flagellatus]